MSQFVTRGIRLRLRSPLCIAQRPTAPGQPVTSLPLISGTTLRGGLASTWLAGQRFATPGDLSESRRRDFQSLFLSGRIRFGACRLALPGLRTDVIPLTAYTAKHGGGWLDDPPASSGVYDILRSLLTNQMIDPELEPLGKRFAATPAGELHYRKAEPGRRLIARTAINPVRGAARDAQLYTLDALETGQEFEGRIEGDSAAIESLISAGVLAPNTMLGVGQGRSRGLGAVEIVDVGAAAPHENRRMAVLDDVTRFNALLGRDAAAQEWILPITLESDIILRDRYLLPSSDANPQQTLGRYQKLPAGLDQHMRLVPAGVMQSTTWIGGWDELRRMPRAPGLAVAMGSVWSFAVSQKLIPDAIDWWLQAERDGLGERRIEGYGQVRLCHPLHLAEEAQ